MIHIDLQPEPPDFNANVRIPGNAFLERCPNPKSQNWNKHNYWGRCSKQLYKSYGGICAYSGQWFSTTTSVISVDHFYPKSTHQEKAYEWDNYRLTTQVMNQYKSDKIIVDPFEIENGDFVIDFPSCLVKANEHVSPALKNKINFTIQVLHLNDETQVEQRLGIVLDYINDSIPKQYLEAKYPFIAEELTRQNLYETIKEIIKFLYHGLLLVP